jgi:hypothetical protein
MSHQERRRDGRKRRRSPRWPAPTIAQFAKEVETSEAIMRALVRSGQIPSVKCNGVQLIPPAAQARYRALFGLAEPSGDAA